MKVILDEICGTTKENFKNNRAFKDHVNDYVEMVGGGLAKRGNDQVTEAAHQLLNPGWTNPSIGSEELVLRQREKDYTELLCIQMPITFRN